MEAQDQIAMVQHIKQEIIEPMDDSIDVNFGNEPFTPKEILKHSRESTPRGNEEEDDIPPDFFDVFSNQDFMEGLDVVDAWDDNDKTNMKEKRGSSQFNRDGKDKSKRTRSPDVQLSQEKLYKRYLAAKYAKASERSDPSKHEQSKEKPKEGTNKEITSTSGAIRERRDPEKTRRDIQKNKVKCAKDKEAKIISEKLKVVETGLVPPGTEMEVDLNELDSVLKKPEKQPSTSSLIEAEEKMGTGKHRRSRSISNERRSRGQYRNRRHSPIRTREDSFERRRYRRNSRSPYRYNNKSPERGIYREGRFRHRHRASSPVVLRRSTDRSINNYSPTSNVSERDIRTRKRGSVSNETDAPSTKRDFLEELADKLNSDEKKKMYYKEIQGKLNESSCAPASYHHHIPPPVPMPTVVPVPPPTFMPPAQFFSSHVVAPEPQYTQEFFVGDGFASQNPYGPYDNQFSPVTVDVVPMHAEPHFYTPEQPNPTVTPHTTRNNSNLKFCGHNVVEVPLTNKNTQEKEKENVNKLFEDKKISLSDFLSVSAKPTDSTKPSTVQKKIQVISVCRDAIKNLSRYSNLHGRFFLIKSTKDPDKAPAVKHQSPLKNIPVIKISTPGKISEEKLSLEKDMNKLLLSLGLPPNVEEVAVAVPIPAVIVPDPPVISVIQEPTHIEAPTQYSDPLTGKKFLMKMCQTEPVKCSECELRKARIMVHQTTQCSSSSAVESGSQTTEEDFFLLGSLNPIKSPLKNQSLVHLTPAQLLGRSSLGESSKKDAFMGNNGSPEKWSNSATNRSIFSVQDRSMPNQNFNPRMPVYQNEDGANNYNQRQFFQNSDGRGGKNTNAFVNPYSRRQFF